LSNGTYWFEVAAVTGANWIGAMPSATAGTTIQQTGPTKCQ
jgi:hypothetical protein